MKNLIVDLQQYQNLLDSIVIAEELDDSGELSRLDAELNHLALAIVEDRPLVESYSVDMHDRGRFVTGSLVDLRGDLAKVKEDNGVPTLCSVSQLSPAGCLA